MKVWKFALVVCVASVYSAVCRAASKGCYLIDKLNRAFIVPPENLDPDALTQIGCQISCAQYAYAFASVENGNMCLCSNTNPYLPGTAVDTARYCNVDCTGDDGAEDCGGSGYCEVFDSLNTPILVTLATGVTFVVGTSGSIGITAQGYQPEFTFDFGDGAAVTEPITTERQSESHTYAIPGYYSVICRAENGFLDGYQDVSEVVVNMAIDDAGVDLVCPTFVNLNNAFDITLTVFVGSRISVDVDMAGVALPTFYIGSPSMYSVGFVAQGTRTNLLDGSDLVTGSTVWVLPGLEILQPGYVMSVEAFVSAPGEINLLILKPICTGGSDVYCPQDNVCRSEPTSTSTCNYEFDYPSNPVYTDYCGSSGIYCMLSGTCIDSGSTCSAKNDRYDESAPRNDYEVVAVIPVTFTVTGAYEYIKVPIADITGGVLAEVGYVIGYETTTASLSWQNITNNTIEYQYSGADYSVGSILDDALATAFKIQHYIRVSTVKELQTIISYNFSTYYEHDITVTVTNDLVSHGVQKTCPVTIQQNITGLTLMMDNHTMLDSSEPVTLQVWLVSGIPALLSINWGDGGLTEEIDRESMSRDVPDNITHSFARAGNLTIIVNASNLLNYEIFELKVTVNNPVDLDAYTITTNSPQTRVGKDKGLIMIIVNYTNAAVKPATNVAITISGGYSFDDVVEDKIDDNLLVGDSCSFEIGFQYSGVYMLTILFENMINSDEHQVEVEILDNIIGFNVIPKHKPVEEQHRPAEDGNQIEDVWFVPIEVPTLFTATVEQGSGITYSFNFSDMSAPVNTDDEEYSHQYQSSGDYTVHVVAANSVGTANTMLSIKVQKSCQDIVVKEGGIVGKDEPKEFTIQIGTLGDEMCLVIDYGDGKKALYSNVFMCSKHPGDTPTSPLLNPLSITHNYEKEGSYILKIEAYNHVSVLLTEHSFAITTLICEVPELTIRDHHPQPTLPRLVQSFDVLRISSNTIINCDEPNTNIKWWNLTMVNLPESGDLEIEREIDLASLTAFSESEIRFEKYTLNVGMYRFVYTVKISITGKSQEFVSSITEFVKVKELELNIAGVDGQVDRLSVGFGQQIEFSPFTYSTDPNIDPALDQGIEVFQIFCRRTDEEWQSGSINEDVLANNGDKACIDVKEDTYGGCFCGGSGMIFPKNGKYVHNTNYTLNTSRMSVNTEYEIVFKGVKDTTRTGLRYLLMTLKQQIPPQPIIRIADGTPFAASTEPSEYGQVLNPTADIRVLGECVQPCNVTTFQWKLKPGNGTHFIDDASWDTQPTGMDTDTMFIPRELVQKRLPDVYLYEIELAIKDARDVKGIAAIKIAFNLPPSDGHCSSSTKELSVGQTVDVTCINWVDDNGIAVYNVYTRSSELSTNSLIYVSETSEVKNLKPSMGPESDGYKLELLIEVVDNLASSTTYSVGDIVVRPPSPEEAEEEFAKLGETLKNENPYESTIAGGDTFTLVQLVSQDGSALNGIRDAADKKDTANTLNTTTPATSKRSEEDLKKEEEENRKTRTVYREKMTKALATVVMKSAKDILLVANAVAVVTNASDEVSDAALDSGLDLVENMVGKLEEFSREIDQNTLAEAGSNIISVLGNLLEGSAQSIDNTQPTDTTSSSSSKTADSEAEAEDEARIDKARNAINKLMSSISDISKNLGGNKLPGEPATAIVTAKITLQVMKDYARMFGNQTTSEGHGSFNVGAWCGGINNSTAECNPDVVISRQSMSNHKNPFNFDKSSHYISQYAAPTMLLYRDERNKPLVVAYTPEKIEVMCPRRGTPEPELVDYYPMVFNASTYMCHRIEVRETKTSLMFDFRPHEPSVYYAVILQYETKPNITDYDWIWYFGFNRTGFSDVNKADGIYSVTLPDTYIAKNTGYYYLCIAEVTPLDEDIDMYSSVYDDVELYLINETLVQLENVTYNYSLVISTTGCKFWDSHNWSSAGCNVGPRTNLSVTHCLCNHLATSFASSWFVLPAPLDFDYIFANAGFLDNITIYCTTIAIYVIFILIFIWARRKDRMDVLKLGVTPLSDNSSADRYLYEITVLTGQRKSGGTDSNVNFILCGEDGETDVRCFDDDQRKIFRRGGVDRFLMAVQQPLGVLNYMRIWHDNSGNGKMQGWYLKYIVVKDLRLRKRYYFIVNRWLSVVEDDGAIDRLIAVAGKDEMHEFSHVFTNHTRKNLNDGHLWFSILSRPAGNRFTRMQRVGCCLMALWLEMLVSIMFYTVRPPADLDHPIKIGPIIITAASIIIGLESSLIVFPISLIVVNFFRKSRPRKKRKSRIMAAYERQAKAFQKNKLNRDIVTTSSAMERGEDLQESEDYQHMHSAKFEQTDEPIIVTTESVPVKKNKRKERFGFPWWCVIFAWILTILSTAAATLFVVFYGIQLGDEATGMWLASLFIGFFTAILFTQPIKVFLISVFIACIMKTPGAEQEEDMDDDEEEFYLKDDEEWLHFPVSEGKSRKIKYQPPNPLDLEEAREQRLKEIKMFSIFREICFYSFFLIILMVVSYGNTNSMAYDVKDVLSSTLQGPVGDFKKITTREHYWSWLRDVLVPSLQPPVWYNGQHPVTEKWYIGDRHSLMLGYAIVRQQRVIPDICDPHEYFADIINQCNVAYSIRDSDSSDHGAEWTPYNETQQVPEFNYTTWDVLDSFPFLGRHALYSGGGFVIDLSEDVETVQKRLDKLHSMHWIDKHTRAVFVEFSVYNGEVNLFGVINMLVEFLPTGSLHPMERIDVIHLLRTYHGFAMFVIVSEGIFIGLMLFFIFKEVNNFRKEGRAYFSKFWNWIEFLIISTAIAGVVLYFYRHLVSKDLVTRFKKNGREEYIKLQYVAYWNEVFMYMLGMIVFLATIKFLKLLRFNRRMAMLSNTLRACSKDLFYFGVMFLIVFLAFVSIFYQLFVPILFDFSGVVYTMESLVGTLLGAFDFESINVASGLLGPLFFFLYMAFMPFLLINIFLTILNESFTEVKHINDQKANDYEMVDFIVRHFKGLLGMNKGKDLLQENNDDDNGDKVGQVVPQKTHHQPMNEIEENISEFPNKVDQLLDTIVKVYFDVEKLDDLIDTPNVTKQLKNINVAD